MTMAALLLAIGSNAQIVSSRSSSTVVLTQPKEKSPNIRYVRAGLNMANIVGKDVEEIGSRAAYDVAIGFQRFMIDNLYWGMEFGLGSRGWKYEYGGAETKLMAHNIRWTPFQIGYKYPITNDFKIEGHFGGFVSFDYWGKMVAEYGSKSSDESIWDNDDYHYVDGGIQLGVGLWYKIANLDFTWQRGFAKWEKGLRGYSSNLMLRLGVAF